MFNNNDNQRDVRHASPWTFPEEKQFERALVKFPEDVPDRWQMMANEIQGGRTAEEVKIHYDELVSDVLDIESGRIPLPDYPDDYSVMGRLEKQTSQLSFRDSAKNEGRSEGRKGKTWTEQEHRLFVYGLEKYGKGDWRSISRNIVKTRTPTQVASHAQKYYMRMNDDGTKKARKRSSIHDITSPIDVKLITPLNTFAPNQQGYQNFNHPPPPPPPQM